MAQDTSNDNEPPSGGREQTPDPHGMAALLLVESLIHTLVARSAITIGEAIDVVTEAAEIEAVMIVDERYPPGAVERSAALLDTIAASLSRDAPDPTPTAA